MSRSSKRLFASLGVLGVIAGGLFVANQYTDGDGAETGDATETASTHDAAPIVHTYASADGGHHLDHPEAFGGEAPRYRADQVMVRVVEGASLREIAEAFGTEVIERGNNSGYATLAVPQGIAPKDFLEQLGDDPGVGSAIPNGIIRGASDCSDFKSRRAARANEHQWHLDLMRAPEAGKIDVSDIIVAVLDTGVAYEAHSDASGTYVAASSLSASDIVAPYDFVNDDEHANDDNQHGTHIASLIAGQGVVDGTASGAGIMPIKVLDADNAGSELDLIEAIYHAVDNGADIINMSLSFAPGYVPSEALLEALDYAAEASVIMVGAAGNNSAQQISYPAASRLVLAVSATDASGEGAAYYANLSNRVDVMAPGGDLTADLNDDGVADGMVAETIFPDDPSQTGLFMYAGTSQAAAVTSGAIANMLATGALPEEIGPALMWGAWKKSGKDGWYEDGMGAGPLDAERSGKAACRVETDKFMPRSLGATVLPYIVRNSDGTITPAARITVTDLDGGKVKKDEVFIDLAGSQEANLSCVLDRDGLCTVEGEPMTPSADGDVFSFEVDSVVDKGIISRPDAVAYADDAFEVMSAAADDAGLLDGAVLGIQWDEGSDADLGELAEAVTVVNMGTGLASSPLGFVFTRPSLSSFAQPSQVDLDGTGLASSPLGFMTVNLYSFSGTGLASSPLGFFNMPIITFSGSGLASSPLGFHALSLYSTGPSAGVIDGSGLASSPLGFAGLTMNFSSTSFMGSGLASSPLGFGAITLPSGGMTLGGSGLASSPLGLTSTGGMFQSGGWASHRDVETVSLGMAGSGLASSPLGFHAIDTAPLTLP